MFDEPSSYLDVKQRLRAAITIRSLISPDRCGKTLLVERNYFVSYPMCVYDIQTVWISVFVFMCRYIIVVEHDLSVLDYLSDFICCLYGVPSAYGVVTMPFSVREGTHTHTGV